MELLIGNPNWSYREQKPFESNLKRSFALWKQLFSYSFLLFLNISFSSCGGKEDKTRGEKIINIAPKKPGSSYQDTLRIQTAAAVFYYPDSLQLLSIRSINDTDLFESMRHDCEFQMKNARNIIKKFWPSLIIVNTVKTRWLQFRNSDGTDIYLDLNLQNDMCGLFLFDREKKPVLADMMNLETQLENYFSDRK